MAVKVKWNTYQIDLYERGDYMKLFCLQKKDIVFSGVNNMDMCLMETDDGYIWVEKNKQNEIVLFKVALYSSNLIVIWYLQEGKEVFSYRPWPEKNGNPISTLPLDDSKFQRRLTRILKGSGKTYTLKASDFIKSLKHPGVLSKEDRQFIYRKLKMRDGRELYLS